PLAPCHRPRTRLAPRRLRCRGRPGPGLGAAGGLAPRRLAADGPRRGDHLRDDEGLPDLPPEAGPGAAGRGQALARRPAGGGPAPPRGVAPPPSVHEDPRPVPPPPTEIFVKIEDRAPQVVSVAVPTPSAPAPSAPAPQIVLTGYAMPLPPAAGLYAGSAPWLM